MRVSINKRISMLRADARRQVADRQRSLDTPGAFRATSAFTMIEIAIALGIIGFALVAIIGILPAGLQVQRDNKEDTIINQEGTYLMEAIRNGAQDMAHLDGFVDFVQIREISNPNRERTVNTPPGDQLISFLSRPSDWQLPNGEPLEVRAVLQPSSGSAVENSEVGFRYQLIVRNYAFTNSSLVYSPLVAAGLSNYVREVRLEFRWPVLSGNRVGAGRQIFRTLIAGQLLPDPRVVQPTGITDEDRWLFQQ
jgi:type II secretory pathway pseudopilin PulG